MPTYPTNNYLTNSPTSRSGQLNWNGQSDCTDTIILGRFRGNPVHGSVTHHAVDFRILEINGQSVFLATPEPCPTPVVVEYCGQVNGTSAEPFDLGIELPQFAIGTSSCYGIAEIALPTSIINFSPGVDINDVFIPDIKLCFTEITFGSLDLFGISINLYSIANLLAVALIIRWWLRS